MVIVKTHMVTQTNCCVNKITKKSSNMCLVIESMHYGISIQNNMCRLRSSERITHFAT